MQRRRLGQAGPVSSCLGLGSMALSDGYGPVGVATSAIVSYALDAGITMLDVSDLPAGSEMEPLIGKAVAGRRAEVLLATRQDAGTDFRRSCDATLTRLGTEYLDIYYLSVDRSEPVECGMTQMAELVAAGKVRHIGLLEGTPQQLRRAHAVHPVAALAMPYSLWQREAEREHLAVARELGVGVVARSPLGRGFLGGRIRSNAQLGPADPRRADPRFSAENLPDSMRMLREAEATAADLDIGMSRLALAWLLSRGDDIVPIPSTRDPIHLEMNIASAEVSLTDEACERLSHVFPPGAA
ncbi:aldo/keto reductase [Streptosporangium soli]|nr:aldo/keto reductase [Streptosporangium sp. KLBMP 9127]